MPDIDVPELPFPLAASADGIWSLTSDGVTGTAPARTDIFIDPGADRTADPNAGVTLNAPTLLGTPAGDEWQLSAQVSVQFASTFDAGVLLLWADASHWAKLCFEYAPDGEPMIVSVVCDGAADDANAFVLDTAETWLRISRTGRAVAFHASDDGSHWKLIRHFALPLTDMPYKVGFEVQSPTGDGCAVRFRSIRFSATRLADLRDGS